MTLLRDCSLVGSPNPPYPSFVGGAPAIDSTPRENPPSRYATRLSLAPVIVLTRLRCFAGLRNPSQAGHRFREPATGSDASRPLIPIEAGHSLTAVEVLSRSASESPEETSIATKQWEVRW